MTAAVPPDDLVGMAPMSRGGRGQVKGGLRGRGGSAMASAIAMNLSGSDPMVEDGRPQPWSEQHPEHIHGWTPQEEALLARGLVIFGRYTPLAAA